MDCESTTRGFNSRRSPLPLLLIFVFFYFFFIKTKKQILFSRLFTTATKNQIIAIFIPFSTSSSKCRITPRGCGFFIPIGPPHGDGWSTGFITTPLTTGRLPSQRLDPALPKLFWFTPTFPTCPTVAEQFLDIKRTSPEGHFNVADLPNPFRYSTRCSS